jgi:hypothetical protein
MMTPILPHLLRSVLILLLTLDLARAGDPARLEQIKHATLSPAGERITLQLNGSYSPKVLTLKGESPRMVLDFADMTHGRGISSITTVNGPIVKTIRVGMHNEPTPKTRVVFDLKTLKGVHISQDFNDKTSTLTIGFTGPPKEAAAVVEKPKHKKEVTTAVQPVPPKEVDAEKKPVTADKPVPPSPAPDEQVARKQPASAAPSQAAQPQPAAASTAPAAPSATKADQPVGAPPHGTIKQQPPAPAQADTTVREATGPDTGAAKPETTKKETDAKQPRPAAPDEQPAQAKPAQPTPQPAAIAETAIPATVDPALESIKFDPSSPKGEMVLFKLNGFYPPAVHGVEEGIPRVICDFNNTQMTGTTKRTIKTNGNYVKAIRTSKTRKPEKVRVVIDLEPNRSYDLQQVFFKDDNLFVIIVNTLQK